MLFIAQKQIYKQEKDKKKVQQAALHSNLFQEPLMSNFMSLDDGRSGFTPYIFAI